jgi:hypothetical protein
MILISQQAPAPAKKDTEQHIIDLVSVKLTVVITLLLILIAKNIYSYVEKQIAAWIEADADRDVLISGLLNQIMAYTEADRVLVGLYHDGDVFINNTHYLKLSVVFEVTGSGVSRVSRAIRNIPLTCMLSDLQSIRSAAGFFAISTKDIGGDCAKYLESIGVNGKLDHMIMWKKKEIGILSLHFVKTTLTEAKIKSVNSDDRVRAAVNELTLLLAPQKPSIWGQLSKIARGI